MKIRYLKNGKKYSNFDTCKDFEIEVVKKGGKSVGVLSSKIK